MSESPAFPPGKVLAQRYQVRRELGRGGMGVVLLCRDLVSDERVALKLLSHTGRVKPEDAWWFHEEARALASLSHAAIVRARDFGSLDDGTPFLVMDSASGRSLHEWIYLAQTDGLLPWPIVWTTVDQVLAALAHAHARGVIHGDLKPSNVLVDIPADGGQATVSVLDLGLAWLMQDRVDHRLDGTIAAEPTVRWGAGTPGWMAPEQIRFATPHIGPGTDLYALGCILFALLSNREPYDGTNEELLEKHRSAPVPDCDIPPGVPREVRAFVTRLMAKRPWHRYDFAGDARRIWRAFEPKTDPMATPIPRGALSVDIRKPTREDITLRDIIDAEVGEPRTVATGLLSLRPSPLVARQAERARLLEIVADVVDRTTGTGDAAYETTQLLAPHAFVLLEGDAGVGKSRLAEWLCEEVHEKALMVPLRARYRRIPAPLDGVLGAVTQHYRLEKADRNVVEKVLTNLWGVSADDDTGLSWVAATAEWLRPLPHGSTQVGPTGKRFTLDRPELRWLVIRRTLERLGRDRPILLWVDDIHEASAATLEGFVRLHRDASTLGIMIVATVRSEAVDADPATAARIDQLLRDVEGDRIRIEPLDAQQTHALLRETLPLDDRAVEEATLRSKGNPLFALQLVHAWAMGGHLELRDGNYSVPESALAARASTTDDLWEERLQGIAEDLRPAAIAAAALGTDVRADVLRTHLKSLGFDEGRAIASMQRAVLLTSSGAERLRWPHGLLQEHLLARLTAQPDAARIFRAAADALATHPAASSRRVLRHRALCLVRAGDYEPAATLIHGYIASMWSGARDVTATLRFLAMVEGKLVGRSAAVQHRWRGEALRHAGQLEAARHEAEEARRQFQALEDREGEAQCLRLAGHIASDLAAPAQGRRLVARALTIFAELGLDQGAAECEVTLGEIDYLLGDHGRARMVLTSASSRFAKLGDRLGRGQCLILLAFIAQAGGSPSASRELLRAARTDLEEKGYRLGLAQCDVALGHAFHREGKITEAGAMALRARQAFRDLANPRGEAASERLLSMTALDLGDDTAAEDHARAAGAIFEQLADPWGLVETRLLMAQTALSRRDPEAAREELIACEAVALVESEPMQHRHLTLAWLAHLEGRGADAARELDAARSAFKDGARTGDHTPALLERFAAMHWPKPSGPRIAAWRKAIAASATATRSEPETI